MTLKQKTISGIQWSAGTNLFKQAMQITVSVILIRILSPTDFGLLGMVMVFVGFARVFADLGFGTALIQRDTLEEVHLSTVFFINTIIGIILTGIACFLAPLIAMFYQEPELKKITMAISASFLLTSSAIVHRAILTRSMDFKALAIVETFSIGIAGIFAIILAYFNFGVWSLVWQSIISSTVALVLLWILNDWRPAFKTSINAGRGLLAFSGNLLGFNVFNYWVRNIDDLLIGRIFGSAGLGLYTRAYSLMLLPLSQISVAVGQVMLPMLSKIQDDTTRVRYLYLSTIRIIALITFPMMIGLFVVADLFVIVLFGSKWISLIPILRVFCLVGMLQSIGTTVGWIYTSQGRTDLQFRWGLVAGFFVILSIIIGIYIGSILSVAVCYTITSGVILAYHNYTIPGKLINMTFQDVFRSVSGVFGCSILMAGLVFIMGHILPQSWPHWLNLMCQVSFGVVIYIVLIHFFKLDPYVELKELFLEQWRYLFQKAQPNE